MGYGHIWPYVWTYVAIYIYIYHCTWLWDPMFLVFSKTRGFQSCPFLLLFVYFQFANQQLAYMYDTDCLTKYGSDRGWHPSTGLGEGIASFSTCQPEKVLKKKKKNRSKSWKMQKTLQK